MGKRIFQTAIGCALTLATMQAIAAPHAHGPSGTQRLCDGFLPKNDMYIPETADGATRGISRAKFDEILNRIQTLYAPEFRGYGATLRIERRWSDGTVNAFADRRGRTWIISMFGGFARHPAMNYDGFASVACHEIGHHVGGAPLYSGDEWASNEGQSDYYATTKCMKRLFEKDDNQKILDGMTVDPLAVSSCNRQHAGKQDRLLCIRVAMAGANLAGVLQSLEGGRRPSLGTPDRTQVWQTKDEHPRAQCRMDTYFQGALCKVSPYSQVSEYDPATGYCFDPRTHTKGLRPRCWFAP